MNSTTIFFMLILACAITGWGKLRITCQLGGRSLSKSPQKHQQMKGYCILFKLNCLILIIFCTASRNHNL
jgi:hypothetical protein